VRPVRIGSTDPRKATIVAALKKLSGCSKVTQVLHHKKMPKLKSPGSTTHEDQFSGVCLAPLGDGKWENKGRFYVWERELGLAPKAMPQELKRAAAFNWIERAKTDLASGDPAGTIDSLEYAIKLLRESIALETKEVVHA